MAAAKATLETMIALGVPKLAEERGRQLSEGVRALAGVASVRGAGMLVGVVLEPGVEARSVVHEALGVGLVVNDPAPEVIRLAPPFTLSSEECDEGIALLGRAIARAMGDDQAVAR